MIFAQYYVITVSALSTFQVYLNYRVPCLDRGFFVSTLSLSGGRNVALLLQLCLFIDFSEGSPGKFLKAFGNAQTTPQMREGNV